MKVGVIMIDKVMFEMILAGGILKFGKVDSADMTLMVKDIDKVFEVDIDRDLMDKYVFTSNGDILLSNMYMRKIYWNINNRKLEGLSVGMIERYFDNMDVMNFVLRKVRFLGEGNIARDDLIHNFSVIQLRELKKLYNEGYVEDYMQEDCMYGDYRAVRVSKLGLVKLFMDENRIDIDNFYKDIIANEIDGGYIQKYLMERDLDDDIDSLLDVSRYLCVIESLGVDELIDNMTSYCRRLVKGE